MTSIREVVYAPFAMFVVAAGTLVWGGIDSSVDVWKEMHRAPTKMHPIVDVNKAIVIALMVWFICLVAHFIIWLMRESMKKRQGMLGFSLTGWNVLLGASYAIGHALGLYIVLTV